MTHQSNNIRVVRSHTDDREQTFPHRLRLLVEPIAFTTVIGVGSKHLTEYLRNRNRTIYGIFKSDAVITSRSNLCKVLIGMNLCSFALHLAAKAKNWRNVKRFYNTYMISDIYGKARSLSMVGSLCHHAGLIHFASNMLVLSLTVPSAPTDIYTTIEVYITGGLISCLGTYAECVLKPGLPSRSCGSSGSISALLGYTAIRYPQFAIAIPFSDKILTGGIEIKLLPLVVMVMLADVLGMTCRWTDSDHIAHVFGGVYGFIKATSKYL